MSPDHPEVDELKPWFDMRSTLKLSFGQTMTQDTSKTWDKPRKSTDLIDWDNLGRFTLHKFVDPFVAFRLDSLAYAGALHDPVAALVFCTPANVDYSVINGRVVVRDGQLATDDLPVLIERHNRLARELVESAS